MRKLFNLITTCVVIIFYCELCKCASEAWNLFQKSLLEQNREEFVITNVTAKEVFSLEVNISKWKTVSIGPTCYTVGLAETGLQILTSVLSKNKQDFDIKHHFFATKGKPSNIVIFHNRKNGQSEAISVVSFSDINKICFYRISDGKVKEFWFWFTDNRVEHINFLKMGTRHILFFTTKNDGFLYEFDIQSKSPKRWFLEMVHFGVTIHTSTFNSYNGQYFLSVSLNDSIKIYKYENNQFQNFTQLQSPQVSDVVSFRIGSKIFLAINGHNAGIYQFSQNGLVRQEIANSHLQGVQFWLPIPVETYRDEVFLLIQRALDHSTHHTYEVDIFTYNNGKFEEHEDIPCTLFEESSLWLSCLTDENGILGSTYIVVGDRIGLIVPRPNNTFILFHFNTTIRQNPDPKKLELVELLEAKKKIEARIEQENMIIEEITNFLSRPVPVKPDKNIAQDETLGASQNFTSQLLEVDAIGKDIKKLLDKTEKLANLENKLQFDTIYINADVKFVDLVDAKDIQTYKINGENATLLLGDIVSKENINKVLKNKTFSELKVENLKTKIANGIDTKNIAFVDEPEVIINGSVIFNQFVSLENVQLISGKINDKTFEDEAVILDKKHEGVLNFEHIKVAENLRAAKINNIDLNQLPNVKNSKTKRNLSGDNDNDTLVIPQNLTATFLNGENLTEFFHSLCLTNRICYIDGKVTITEKIHAAHVETKFLNGLKFPEEYILNDSNSNSQITGKKTFKNSLKANDIRSTGKINGVDTKKLVTLSTDQNLTNITFENLELTESLDVKGKIVGEDVDKFLVNPTLEEDNHIMSNVNFKNLEVKGNIIIENNFNDENYSKLLQDIFYSDEDQAIIISSKDFTKSITVDNNLQIKSNSINTVQLTNFVTKNTEQNLKVNLLKGNVSIKNLVVNGTYDGKNITELDEKLVKLTGDQFISSTLSFQDLVVKNLDIDERLNDVEAKDYLYTTANGSLEKHIHFNKLVVEDLVVKGNLHGSISGFDLNDINEKYLSISKNQTIKPFINITSSTVDNIKAEKINNNTKIHIIDESSYTHVIRELLDSGHLKVKNLNVEDSIDISTVNNKPVATILPTTILDVATKNGNKLVFENDIYLKEIQLNNLSYVPWNEYVNQIVFKNETNVKFANKKQFLNGISVENLLETKKINGVVVKNILTKEGEQTIRGPIRIQGDLNLENVEIEEEMNETPIKDVLKVLTVPSPGNYKLKRDMMFERLSYIQSLNINGTVNGKNTKDFFNQLVNKDKPIKLKNDIVFTKPVNIFGNLALINFNDLNFSDIKSKIVFISQDTNIVSPVTFTSDVHIHEKMLVDEYMLAETVAGFKTEDWQEKAIYTNRGLLKGNFSMDHIFINEELTTKFINNLDMTKLIPLRSNQSIDYLHFEQLKFLNNISVGKTVNGLYLPDEIKRTLMNDNDQYISPATIFTKNVLIRQNLETKLLNNKETSKIVTTKTKQNLTANYSFQSKVSVDSDLHIKGWINGVNFENWKTNTLKLYSNNTQYISNDWNVQNLTFEDNVDSFSNISDLDIPKIAKDVQNRKDYSHQVEHKIIADYEGLCKNITYLYEKTKSQIYKFKYFEDFQDIFFVKPIKHVFHFYFKTSHYLLVNQENCLSDLLIFNGTKFIPLFVEIATGQIEQVVTVNDKNSIFLVMRGPKFNECSNIDGTNVWEFDGSNLDVILMDPQDLLQESQVPSTFYAFGKDGVVEYKIKKNTEGPLKYRKWKVSEDNVAFMPRGLKTGLALRTGQKIIFLERNEPIDDIELDLNIEAVIKGSTTEVYNHFVPGKNDGDVIVLKVGVNSARKNLLAVASHEETIVKGSLDFIKIYEDSLKGYLFDKVKTYKPSSLLSLEFGQGETLLAFLENRRLLQIYEYKGIEGFQLRMTINVNQALSLFQMDLAEDKHMQSLQTIGIVYKNRIRLIQAVTEGNRIHDDLKCNL